MKLQSKHFQQSDPAYRQRDRQTNEPRQMHNITGGDNCDQHSGKLLSCSDHYIILRILIYFTARWRPQQFCTMAGLCI